MMGLDVQCMLSEDQAITADAASTNIYDNGAASIDHRAGGGRGQPLVVIANVTEAFLTIVSLILSVRQSATQSASALTGTITVLVSTGAVLLASLVVGFQFAPLMVLPTQRYVDLLYDVSTSATAGKITAYITSYDNWAHGLGM